MCGSIAKLRYFAHEIVELLGKFGDEHRVQLPNKE
jgi:hypothetical protein